MRNFSFLLTLIAAAMLPFVTDASATLRGSRTERIKEYTKLYQQSCKPSPLCTRDCQDLYDFLRREGVDVGGPCGPHS
jgi:hypothetical protein